MVCYAFFTLKAALLAEVLPYPNKVAVICMTGAQLRDAADHLCFKRDKLLTEPRPDFRRFARAYDDLV